MFDILTKPIVTLPVNIPILEQGPDGLARPATATMRVEVEILDTDAIQAIFSPPDGVAMNNFDAAKLFVTGWHDVKSNGKTAPFNDDNLMAALKRPGFANALFVAYLAAINDAPDTREGNSDASLAPSPADEAANPQAKAS